VAAAEAVAAEAVAAEAQPAAAAQEPAVREAAVATEEAAAAAPKAPAANEAGPDAAEPAAKELIGDAVATEVAAPSPMDAGAQCAAEPEPTCDSVLAELQSGRKPGAAAGLAAAQEQAPSVEPFKGVPPAAKERVAELAALTGPRKGSVKAAVAAAEQVAAQAGVGSPVHRSSSGGTQESVRAARKPAARPVSVVAPVPKEEPSAPDAAEEPMLQETAGAAKQAPAVQALVGKEGSAAKEAAEAAAVAAPSEPAAMAAATATEPAAKQAPGTKEPEAKATPAAAAPAAKEAGAQAAEESAAKTMAAAEEPTAKAAELQPAVKAAAPTKEPTAKDAAAAADSHLAGSAAAAAVPKSSNPLSWIKSSFGGRKVGTGRSNRGGAGTLVTLVRTTPVVTQPA
jgi:hypothetical protein